MYVFAEPFPRVDGWRADASEDILSDGNGLQMTRIYAMPDSAKVVELETIGDFSYQCLVGDTMGHVPPFCAGVRLEKSVAPPLV